MSSDVYLDFGDAETVRKGLSAWPYSDTDRIGHLGTLSYFGFNLVDALRTLRRAFPIVTAELADGAERLAERFRSALKEDRESSDEWFSGRYGYERGSVDFDDCPGVGELAELFRENLGKAWCVRVD